MAQLPLTLTQDETRLLSDRIGNTDKEDGVEIGKPLLLKLASCFLELLGDKPTDATATVYVSEREAWLIRGKFTTADRSDRDALLGIHALRKVYAILLAFDAADAAPALADADAGNDRTYRDSAKIIDWPPETPAA